MRLYCPSLVSQKRRDNKGKNSIIFVLGIGAIPNGGLVKLPANLAKDLRLSKTAMR